MYFPSHQSPITNHQSPVTSHQSPITSHQSPITHHQSPVTNHESPITKRGWIYAESAATATEISVEVTDQKIVVPPAADLAI
ncbi:MAG: hypothetical protein ACKO2Z_27585, partial [Sphaerospermopsis kisseleviana]